MNQIRHLIEPRRLLLSWQRPIAGSERRTRRIIGEIECNDDGAVFRYLSNREDFAKAEAEGFRGFPAFGLKQQSNEFTMGVLDAFMRRLPPRKREDFREYLTRFRLPENFSGTDMALLAYTGAKLPGDGFELVPDLDGVEPPMELVIEVAGFRHQEIPVGTIAAGDSVRLVPEPDNEQDNEAIGIVHANGRIGYVPRPYCGAFGRWIGSHAVEAQIDRINGKPDRPLVYLFVAVS